MLITDEAYPFEFISAIAAQESHRKEVNRPIYHISKWWAQRLGSVFRALIIGCHVPDTEAFKAAFYQRHDYGTTVFDPFMGSGTTLGEAHKLGCIALGRDINPVAYAGVKNSLSYPDRRKLLIAFKALSNGVGKELLHLTRAHDSRGRQAQTLYYFWVKLLPCSGCEHEVELFSSYIFSKDAYVKKKPGVQVICPSCSGVLPALYTDTQVSCPNCTHTFDPHNGPVDRATATCRHCGTVNKIAEQTRKLDQPLASKMYAKMVLTQDGKKEYLAIDDYDRQVFAEAEAQVAEVEEYLPNLPIAPGHNTDQVLKHGYSNWIQFFNQRQLASLGLLVRAIRTYPDEAVRNSLLLLFSTILDFNNTFASFKGEGTGAVRHMFAHHILKPERTPLEANVWGTPKSSGSFSTLFKTKLLRAIDYQEDPFEINPTSGGGKVFGISAPFTKQVSTTWDSNFFEPGGIYVSCGGSQTTGLADESVDFVVTDPPFFDNVHYSELADFFYAWQRNFFPTPDRENDEGSTRSIEEVQDKAASKFGSKLSAVFAEAARILKPGGLLVFSYHHSRAEGWTSLAEAVAGAGFSFVQAHPIQSEMVTAIPKAQAKSPIAYDIIAVCKKAGDDDRAWVDIATAAEQARASYYRKIARLKEAKLPTSYNDKMLISNSALLVALSPHRSPQALASDFKEALSQLAIGDEAPLVQELIEND
jgi:putative DNA methylase